MGGRRRILFIVGGLLILGALVLIGIAVFDDDQQAEAVDPGALGGTSWQIVEATGPWGRVVSEDHIFDIEPLSEIAIVASAARLRFGQVDVIGVEGCRDFAMATTIEGTSISFGTPTTDETLCTDPALRTLPFLNTIASATTITTIDGLLQLKGPDGEIRFEQIQTVGELRAPDPTPLPSTLPQPARLPDLTGTQWTLSDIEGPGGPNVVEGHPVTVTFDETTLGGSTGCNPFTAIYTLTDGVMTISQLAADNASCEPAGAMQAEDTFLDVLADANRASVGNDATVLTIEAPSGVLVFRTAAPD